MTSPAAPPPDAAGTLLGRQLDAAARRWRLELFSRALSWIAAALAAGFGTWALLAVAEPSTARHWPAGLLVASGAVALAAAECRLREPGWPRICRRVDRQLGLPDTVLTAAEFLEQPAATRGDRVRLQLDDAAATLRGVSWPRVWPVRAPRGLAPSLVVAAAALAFLGWRAARWEISQRPAPPSVHDRETAQAFRTLLDDWDQSQRDQPDDELKKILADLQPLRERLARPDAALDEHEAFQQLSRIEEKIAAARARLDAQSLAPFAPDLAAALEKVNGLGALAAAVRRGDFGAAQEQAARDAQQMAAADARVPQDAGSAEAAERLGKLSQQLGEKGNQGAQQSTAQMQSGLQKKDASQMGQGLQGLGRELAAQNARDAQKGGLSHQLRQTAAAKQGLADGANPDKGLSTVPRLTAERSRKPGKGAGAETDLNRNGAPTGLASDRAREALTGKANESGQSDTTSVSTVEPTGEHTRAASAARFQSYEKLSEQAVADENIPLAHRQTIRRYFEAIRPAAGDK